MNDADARRIVRARALMWERATPAEQAEYLRMADEAYAELSVAAAGPVAGASSEEGDGHPRHADRVADRIGAAQNVTDWLRDRADDADDLDGAP